MELNLLRQLRGAAPTERAVEPEVAVLVAPLLVDGDRLRAQLQLVARPAVAPRAAFEQRSDKLLVHARDAKRVKFLDSRETRLDAKEKRLKVAAGAIGRVASGVNMAIVPFAHESVPHQLVVALDLKLSFSATARSNPKLNARQKVAVKKVGSALRNVQSKCFDK